MKFHMNQYYNSVNHKEKRSRNEKLLTIITNNDQIIQNTYRRNYTTCQIINNGISTGNQYSIIY